jgi:hypothetical protein
MEGDCWSIKALRDVNSSAASVTLKKNLMVPVRLTLILSDRGDPTIYRMHQMKLTTIALAIALTVPSTFALARGGITVESHVTPSFGGAIAGHAGRIANRPRNVTGNTLAPIAGDPSGSTISGSAMNRTGG